MTIGPGASSPEVAGFYDTLGAMLSRVWDDNFHYGWWEDAADTSTIAEATERFTDVLVPRLAVGAGDRVLDLGCGIGKPALRIASLSGARVLGVSNNRDHLVTATERTAAAGLAAQVRFEYASALRLPYADASFDAVLAFESVIHMDRAAALEEVARVLKPGGRVVLTDLTAPAGPSEAVMTSYASPRFYQDIIPALGLHLVELTDVSEHTAPTTARLTEQILRHREELEAELGASLEQIWHDTMPAGLTAGDIGCIVVVAAKPRPARAQSCP